MCSLGSFLRGSAVLLGIASTPVAAQPVIRLSGYVRSSASGEVIRYARISADGQPSVAESNQDGFFVLALPPGSHQIRIRAVGFAPKVEQVTLTASVIRDFLLDPRPLQLEEITVAGRRDTSDVDPASAEMSTARLEMTTVRLVPVVLGEVDPIRALTLLPGVTTISDYSTGFSVRGGTTDQNLILLDESTIYNPAHVFGFFSVFNGDAIDDVKLYKGAIPARYGGRLSSVLDVRQREGNAKRFEGGATIGLLASRMSLEGPLPDRIGSYLVAARRTYADLFLKLSSDPDLNQNVAYFYDVNAKTNVRLGASGAVMVSGYFGRDRFKVAERFAASWGNQAGTLRWNQAFGSRLFSKLTATVSDYDYGLEFLGIGRDLSWTARIGGYDLKLDQTYHVANGNRIEFGGALTRHNIRPGSIRPVGDSPVRPLDLQPRYGLAPALHASHEIELGPAVSLRYGVRYAGFRRLGAGTIYRYAGGPLRYDASLGRYQKNPVADSTEYRPGETIVSRFGLEPRLSLRVGLAKTASLKAGYSRTRQFLHLVSNTNSPTPVDIWEPIGRYLEPQLSDQLALGFAKTWDDERYEFSAEAYYKRLANVTDFIDGADIALNDRLETEMLQGTGRSYGLELYARKRAGRLTGWVSYTLGRAERRLRGIAPDDPGINGGRYYPSPYDKTHDLSVVGFHPLSRTWTVAGTFVAASGLPATFPESRYRYNGLLVVEYGPRNAARLPTYHRLDLTFTRTTNRSQWQFGLFNLYNRFNAQSIAFQQVENNPLALEAVQTSIFGIVPSVSFSFAF
ncbi:MAG: TonB-dependent receptor [Gemmatimonadetes bacterium]|nr:TonB-dependent receptor [Gemmatimonadota bacterium]